jgi:hypothetical protein
VSALRSEFATFYVSIPRKFWLAEHWRLKSNLVVNDNCPALILIVLNVRVNLATEIRSRICKIFGMGAEPEIVTGIRLRVAFRAERKIRPADGQCPTASELVVQVFHKI